MLPTFKGGSHMAGKIHQMPLEQVVEELNVAMHAIRMHDMQQPEPPRYETHPLRIECFNIQYMIQTFHLGPHGNPPFPDINVATGYFEAYQIPGAYKVIFEFQEQWEDEDGEEKSSIARSMLVLVRAYCREHEINYQWALR